MAFGTLLCSGCSSSAETTWHCLVRVYRHQVERRTSISNLLCVFCSLLIHFYFVVVLRCGVASSSFLCMRQWHFVVWAAAHFETHYRKRRTRRTWELNWAKVNGTHSLCVFDFGLNGMFALAEHDLFYSVQSQQSSRHDYKQPFRRTAWFFSSNSV